MVKRKTKNYTVLMKAYSSVVVLGARDQDDALEIANAQISNGDFEIDEARIESELTTDQELESAKRHANKIAYYE